MVKYSPFIHIPDRMARKAGDVSAADWRYHTHVKKYDILSRVFDIANQLLTRYSPFAPLGQVNE